MISWGIEAIDDTGDTRFSSMFHFTTIGDSSPPSGSILINNGDSSTTSYSVTLNLSATDSDSGVAYMRFSNDGVSWTDWKFYSSEYVWNLADLRYGGQYGLTTYTVFVKFRDSEENESSVYSDTINKVAGTPGQILLNGESYVTIQDAVDAASPGDTVYLTEGVYEFEGVNTNPTNHPGMTVGIQMRSDVTLKGAGAEKTVIDVSGWAFTGIVDADNVIIEGLTIINSGRLSWRYGVLLESDSSTIKNCIIKGAYRGIYIGWDSTYSASNSNIMNNLLINNDSAAIRANHGTNIFIYNNTIANNNLSGIAGNAFDVAPLTIKNNIIAFNGIGIGTDGTLPVIQYNNVYSNYQGTTLDNYQNIPDQTGINGNISADPSFVNASSGDYHLNSGSPCINAGTNVGIPYNSSAPDIGAFEYNGTGTVQVISNQTDSSFTIQGPSGTYSGNGTNWSQSNLPIGIYIITFTPITNYYSPSYQSIMLYSGQTLIFDGTYQYDTIGPDGTMLVDFSEYSTDDNLVTITLDISDEVAGLGVGSQMIFSNDGVTWSTAEVYDSIKKDWDLTLYGGNSTSGTKTVYTKVSDLLGNWSTFTDTILYVPNRQILEVPSQYSTIQDAINAAQGGDMVYVLPGTYTESLTLTQGIRLQGAGPSQTILNKGSSSTIITAADNCTIDGFTIGQSGAYISIKANNTSPIVSNNVLYGMRGVEVGSNSKAMIRNNLIRTSNYGIAIFPAVSVLMDLIIQNNTITSNVGSTSNDAILLQNPYSLTKLSIINNIIANNDNGINESGGSDLQHEHIFPSFNTYWNNNNNFTGNFDVMGPGDMDSDPIFADTSNNDYHLMNGSASIDSGNPETRYNDPDRSRNDRGAYGGPTLNTPPIADFTITPLQGSTNTNFTFDAGLSHDGESQDSDLEVRWDIDSDGAYDSSFSSNKTLTYQYNLPGTYDVTIQVKDKGGFISTESKSVDIINQSPNVPGNPIPIDGSSAQDVNLFLIWSGGDPDTGDIVTYDVYLGTSANPPLVSSDQLDTFYDPGALALSTVYFWKVIAKDSYGSISASPIWYFITNARPSANTTGIYSAVEGQAIILDGSSSNDSDGSIVCYEWDIDNDDIFDYACSSLPTQSHVYAQDNTYTIRLRVTDNMGVTDEITATANISDTSPTASFTGSPSSGTPPLTVNLTNSSTGYDQPLSYDWDFDNDGNFTSTLLNPSYDYPVGIYSVKLKVTDSDGSTNTLLRTDYISSCLNPISLNGNNLAVDATLQDAYDAATNGDTIQVQAKLLSGNLNANRNISVTLEGGHNCDYTTISGLTTFTGDITISNGTLTIENFLLQQ
jgi:PKD repeat protein